MIGFIQNYRVRNRLAVGFGILLALLVALGVFALSKMAGIQAQLDDIALDNTAKTTQTEIMFDRTGQAAILIRNIALMDDPQYAAEQAVVLASLRRDYDAARAELEKRPPDAEGRVLRERIDAARAVVMPLNDEVLRLGQAKRDDDAKAVLLEKAAPAVETWQGALRENLILQARNTAQAHAAALDSYRDAKTVTIVIIVLALLVGVALSILITASLTGPLADATRVARQIAEGRLDGRIRPSGNDELAELLGSMQAMQQGLQRFAQAQGEIARQHDVGEIDYRIPAAEFSGAYAEMAEQINTLVATHIAVKMQVVEIVSAYARGDLSRDMERLPGKKAQVTAAVDAVKNGMQSINGQIRELVEAAVAGDFSRRGDAGRFEFVYREMIERLNGLMQTADGGLGEIGRLLSSIADGDLGQRADDGMPGQFGQLAADANRTVEQLGRIVGEIRQGSDEISAAASEIAAGNNDLSQRTEQQAASLEETASSMEELTSTVHQTADNARQASQLATGAAEVAVRGGEVVGRVVDTMSAINASSRRIVDIISVIDGIAFQTNILALNAAVEAARAGEQGRGFAVVASEVRSLAQRSAGAAKEIKQLIDDSVEKVESGTELVDNAGRTMEEIVDSVKRVTDLIADIAAASQEQSAGIEQVNQAVLQMDEGTQQNAALVEEASAAARSLEQQSTRLVQTVAAFRSGERGMAAAVPAARTVPTPITAAPMRARPEPAPRPVPAPASTPRARAVNDTGQWQEF
ncbi:methyl-accepting chemotaxis protein [Lysobacter sp. F60174L2]|uniref:methyl-accepting chemotaxis protein n=1 Tax=Lysobacter sp. F60174L2 TaxID=3459295 RepID=UPI00403D6572